MSLPPEIITVKRKRRLEGDDEPVNFLRVEETKRQASGTWLYRRTQPAPTDTQQALSSPRLHDGRSVIQTTRPGEQKRLQRSQLQAPSTTIATQVAPKLIAPLIALPGTAALPSNSNAQPRRFHLSRADIQDSPNRSPDRGGRKRARHAPAVFVERNSRPKRVAAASSSGKVLVHMENLMQPTQQEAADEEMRDVATPSRQLKRPGGSSRIRSQVSTTERGAPKLPLSLINNRNIEQEMNDFILQEIEHNVAQLEAEAKPKTTPVKYRPRAPPKRYGERHPDAASPHKGEEDVDMDASETEEGDYVVETYERVPAHAMKDPVPAEQVGLLVFDEETDIEYFYGGGDDTSDEYDEEDVDSNAEDYYAADYPEDEVASDDEYGRDDYHFRTGNASDMEEYYGLDEDDDDVIARSDDEAGAPLPGAVDLWRLEKTMRAKLGLYKSGAGNEIAMD